MKTPESMTDYLKLTDAQKMELVGLPSVPSNALLAVSVAAQRLLDAWDAKTPLAWQPENNRVLLEDLRAALKTANAEAQRPAVAGTLPPLVGDSGGDE